MGLDVRGGDMGVERYPEEVCLSPEIVALELRLRAEDVVFVTGSFPGDAGGGESGVLVVLLTDEAGFAERAPRFAPERRVDLLRLRVGVVYERVGGVDVEVHVMLRATIEGLLDALSAPDAGESRAAAEVLDPDAAAELLHRLRRGRALANEAAFEGVRARLCPRRLAAWGVRHALARSGDAMVGTRTSLRENDVENAYLKLAHLYDALGDAVLYSKGQSVGRFRWRLSELRAFGPVPFVDRYLDVKLGRRPPSEPLGAFVERHLEAAGDVVERLRGGAWVPSPS